MAIVWQGKVSGSVYEVRSAGKSLRLYTDGVFHSQYNPGQLLTGHVWDLLMLPAFFYPQTSIKRVLLLGVGGGAVIHQLRHFIRPELILGVELNATHVMIGRRFFDLKGAGVQLVEADAVSWLQDYQGEGFDMIIDDLFAESAGEPISVVAANQQWFNTMLNHLKPEGVIVRNFISREELFNCAALTRSSIQKKFTSAFQFNSFYNENFVAAFLRRDASSAELRQRLKQTPGLNPSLKSSRLRYRIRRLF